MTTVTNVKGTNLTLLDATQPFLALTSGEGAKGYLKVVEDLLPWSTTMGSAAGNYGKLCRFPANAKVKSLEVYFDAIPDVNATQTLAIEFGVVFSDSTIDGTPAQYQGLIPTTVGIGGGSTTAGTTVSFATHTNANAVFGTWTLSGNDVNPGPTNIFYNGSRSNYPILTLTETPLVEIFNFLDGRGVAMENLGYFDLYAYVTNAYGTVPAAALNLFAKLTYAD